jgi:hypothetical protein
MPHRLARIISSLVRTGPLSRTDIAAITQSYSSKAVIRESADWPCIKAEDPADCRGTNIHCGDQVCCGEVIFFSQLYGFPRPCLPSGRYSNATRFLDWIPGMSRKRMRIVIIGHILSFVVFLRLVIRGCFLLLCLPPPHRMHAEVKASDEDL